MHIGEVAEPDDDSAKWNGYNSERAYCDLTGKVPVLYCGQFPCFTCRERYPGGFRPHSADCLVSTPSC